MKVSVIIPTYNEEKVIGECLELLSKQSYTDMEIIVVDDGSTDKTVNVLSELKIKNLKFKIVRGAHRGAGAARNLGAQHVSGGILVFVDADMIFDKEFIANLIKPIIQGKVIGTFSKDEFLANKENVWARCWNINRGLPPTKMHPENYPNTQKVFRAILKKEFEKAGGFDEKAGYTDDWTLSEKLGVEAVAAPGAVFYHKNPETLLEVFIQSKWMAKRRYKVGLLGYIVALLRTSFPVSILLSILLAISHQQLAMLVFKPVSDFGQFIGIIEYIIFGKVSK